MMKTIKRKEVEEYQSVAKKMKARLNFKKVNL